MSRCGNPYDNAKAESFMKTLKAEAVYLTEYDTYEEVAADLPRFIEEIYNARRLALRPGLPEPDRVRKPQHPPPGQNRSLSLSNEKGALQPLLRGADATTRPPGRPAPGLHRRSRLHALSPPQGSGERHGKRSTGEFPCRAAKLAGQGPLRSGEDRRDRRSPVRAASMTRSRAGMTCIEMPLASVNI